MGTQEMQVLSRLEDAIEANCERIPGAFNDQDFRTKLIKWCYNSVDVIIDYKSKRIFMNLILDSNEDSFVQKNFGNKSIPFILKYEDLPGFLKECVVKDNLSLKFYERILRLGHSSPRRFHKKSTVQTASFQ